MSYKDAEGDISIKLYQLDTKEDDAINDLLDGLSDFLNVGDTLSFNLTTVLTKESNDVMTIDEGSSISGIKIPATVINDNMDVGEGNSKLIKTVVKMGTIHMVGKVVFGKTVALKGYLKGLLKMVTKASGLDPSQIFDAFLDLVNNENSYFKMAEEVEGDE